MLTVEQRRVEREARRCERDHARTAANRFSQVLSSPCAARAPGTAEAGLGTLLLHEPRGELCE